MLKDAFNRLIKASLIGEVRSDRKTYADFESIKTFETTWSCCCLLLPE